MNPNYDRFPSSPTSRSADAFRTAPDVGAVRTSPHAPADPAVPHPRRRGPRPLPPGVEYHRVLAGEKRRIGRGILAIVLLVAGMFVFSFIIAQAAASIDTRMGRTNPTLGGTDFTPLYQGAGLFSVALLIPWSMLIQRWLYGVRGASMHSVVSRFRLDVFGRALLFIGPVWLVNSVFLAVAMPGKQTYWSFADLVGMVAVTLLLTPVQAAGEEYGFRGLVFRVAGSWGRGPRTALIIGVLTSSLVFMAVHLSTDPWLNLWYFTLGAGPAVITWRTGGIETGVVVHALNNTLSLLLATAVHVDLVAPLLDRSAGAGSPALLIPCLTLVSITAVVWLRTRTTGPALTPVDPRSVRV
ncbi:CPBP family intramembrane metalloprotease [Saccharopolyspora erythraea]|uniref:CPBP family intramembrane glutamic endopeptidase n=1 Tax=Saccharopolyspora erythraea TaxID=1836 RepID=UPI001BA69E85|nr:type II CAAX endopeptidase family protein [Saccharopolyspora erythraea]QUH02894.1 CPBP family intramembrane metalloprotease [Saccharopolyspora erythraea]